MSPGRNGSESGAPLAAASDHVRDELVRFVRALRRAGVAVPANAGVTAGRALADVGLDDPDRVRVALRASLVADATDRPTFDRLFEAFWRRLAAGPDTADAAGWTDDGPEGGLASFGAEPAAGEAGDGGARDDENEADEAVAERHVGAVIGREATASDADSDGATTARYSPNGRRTAVSAAHASHEFGTAFDTLTESLATLSGRRWRAGGDERPDVRRALRASVATGGTVVEVPRRRRARSELRACLLVDVSRSVLDVVDRSFLLEFLRRAHEAWREARVFFFDDDLREVTSAFGAPDERALDALSRAEAEWGGGTRIGGSLARLHERASDAVSRDSVVFVVSDGLEMGDVETLEREAAWLSRRARAVFWLNPLAVSPEYEPTARGMAAALPYLDGLFAFAGPDDLAELARQLDRRGHHGRIGYEYDPRRVEATHERRHTA